MNQNYGNAEEDGCHGSYTAYTYSNPNLPTNRYRFSSGNKDQDCLTGPCIHNQDCSAVSCNECSYLEEPCLQGTFPSNQDGQGAPGGSVLVPNELSGSQMMCYRCEELVTSELDQYPTPATHVLVCLFAVLGLALFMFIPYICNWCGRPVQRCPNCGAFLTEPSTKPLKEPIPLR